jgi:hypothetical protein
MAGPIERVVDSAANAWDVQPRAAKKPARPAMRAGRRTEQAATAVTG